jgi:hypothetical protein
MTQLRAWSFTQCQPRSNCVTAEFQTGEARSFTWVQKL